MRVALVVDNPYRDLPGLVLLGTRLCQEGATCFLVPMYFGDWKGREFWTLAPDFVLVQYLRSVNEWSVRQLLDAGIRVGLLETEGGVLDSFDGYAVFLAQDQEVRHRIACYCSWGPKLAEHATRAGWYREAQVEVTGAPRFDYYTPLWREAALHLSPFADAYPRPLVLVNGSFPVNNPRFQTPEQEVQMLVEHFGYERDFVVRWQNTDRETMQGMARLTNHLAARFPKVTFVYRPHPFEKLETYHDLLDKRDNLHLVKKGTVDGWILRSSAVIQRSCSTAIEAGMAGVPTLLPAWLPVTFSMPAAEGVSVPCQTEGEMAQALASILAGDFERPAAICGRLDKVIADWFYRIDGRAHERVAGRVLQGLPADGRRERLRTCQDRAHAWQRPDTSSWKYKTAVSLKKALGLSVHWSCRRLARRTQDLSWWPGSEKYFGATQVQAIVEAIQRHGPNGPGRTPRRVGVCASQERGDYHFGYLEGQSVTLFPE